MANEGLSAPIALPQPQPPDNTKPPEDTSNQQGLSAPIALQSPAPVEPTPAPVEPAPSEPAASTSPSSPADSLGLQSSLPPLSTDTKGVSGTLNIAPQEDTSYLMHPGKWLEDTLTSLKSAVPEVVTNPSAAAPFVPKAIANFEGTVLEGISQWIVGGVKNASQKAAAFAPGDKQLQQDTADIKALKVENTPIYQAGSAIIDHWQLTQQQQLKAIQVMGPFGSTAADTASNFLPYMASEAVAGPVATAALSSLSGGGSQLEDAVAHKATDEQKQVATAWGAMFGVSYLLPVHITLARLGQVPGGNQFTKLISEYLDETPWLKNLAEKADNPLVRAGGNASVIALQQAAMQVGNNLTARDFAGYDPNRDPLDGLRQAVEGGVGAGTVMALMVEMLHRGAASYKAPELSPGLDESTSGTQAQPQAAPQAPAGNSVASTIVPPFEHFAQRTSVILEQFADKPEVNFSELKQAAAKIGGGEQKLINSTLQKFEGQKTVDMQQFKMALQSQFLDIRTSSFYGTETLGYKKSVDESGVRLREDTPEGNLFGSAGTHVLPQIPDSNLIVHIHKAPYVNLGTVVRSPHYHVFPDYYAHSRGGYVDGIPHIFEIQSDLAGKREQLTKQNLKPVVENTESVKQASEISRGLAQQEAALTQEPYYMKQAAREVMALHAQKGDSVIRFASPEVTALAESWLPDRVYREAIDYTPEGRIQKPNAGEIIKNLIYKQASDRKAIVDFAKSEGMLQGGKFQDHSVSWWEDLAQAALEAGREDIQKILDGFGGDHPELPTDRTKLYAGYEKFTKWLVANGATEYFDKKGKRWFELPLKPEWGNAAQVQFDGLGLGFVARHEIDKVTGAFGRGITPPKEPGELSSMGSGGTPPERPIREDLDKFSQGMRILDTLQMVVDKNKNVPVLGDILQRHWRTLGDWWQLSLNWKYRGEQTIRNLYKTISYGQRKQLYDFMAELGAKSHGDKKRYEIGSPEFVELAKKYKLGENHIAAYDRIDKDFQSVVTALKEAATKELAKLYLPDNQNSYNIQLHKLDDLFKPLFNVNFLPFTRFGKRVVSVIAREAFVDANGRQWKPGETVDMEAIEGPLVETQAKFMLSRKQREFANKPVTVVAGRLSDKHFSWQMLPVEMQEILRSELGLNPEQQSALADMLAQLSPTQSFARHLISRKGTPGFSRDVPRAYAEYMGRFGNHIARLTYGGDLRDSIKQVSDSALQMRYEGKDNNKRMQIYDHLNDHYNYIMNRDSEWATGRALAFLWYLSFMPKTALVNALQPAMFTYPYLAAKYGVTPGLGDVKAISAITKAYKNLTESKFHEIFDRATKDASMVFPNPKVIEPDLSEALYRMVKDGTLDQSIATEIAAAQRGSLLDKTSIGSAVGSGARKIAEYGAWPFQKMELLNRYVTAIAGWRMAKKSMENALGRKFKDWTPAEREALYNETKEAVQKTQFEYSFWNRPRYAWGKRSSMFVFTMYTRNSLYFYRHTSGRGRALAMLLALGGVSAMPFAQDIENFLDFAMNSVIGRKTFGIPPGKFWNTNMLLHEYLNAFVGYSGLAKELGVNTSDLTELLMHGAGHKYGLGPLVALRNVGIPVPYTDVSSSLSLGNVIPGSHLPVDLQNAARGQESTAELIGNTVKSGTGVLGSMGYNLMTGLINVLSGNKDAIKTAQLLTPHFISNELKAGEAAAQGGYTTANGTMLVPIDTKNPGDIAELVAQGIGGFTPTRLAEAQEKYYAERLSIAFYESQRRILLANLAQAVSDKDPQEKEAARNEIKRFNASAPKGLYIIGKSRQDAIERKAREDADKAKGTLHGKSKAAASAADAAFEDQSKN